MKYLNLVLICVLFGFMFMYAHKLDLVESRVIEVESVESNSFIYTNDLIDFKDEKQNYVLMGVMKSLSAEESGGLTLYVPFYTSFPDYFTYVTSLKMEEENVS